MGAVSNSTPAPGSLEEQGLYRDICERALPMVVLGMSVIMFGGTLTKYVVL